MSKKRILIAQNTPLNLTPYTQLEEKFDVEIEFKRFFMVEPLTSREFREQKVNLADFTAIVFSSRHAIDAYFRLTEELRIKVPDTMKYFCTTEAVAMYLQKHIVYRKRKIFFGNGTPQSVLNLIGTKHSGENFLITRTDGANSDSTTRLFDEAGLKYTAASVIKAVPQDLKSLELGNYDIIVLYNPNDVKSLFVNFPQFTQGDIKFVAYGKSIVSAMESAGLHPDVKAPTPQMPSVALALAAFLSNDKS